jgi:hypothetical protein
VLRSPDRWLQRIPRLAWVAAYLVLVTGFLTFLFAGWAYDDPFITYRYAENLSRGLGLVYNPGEVRLSTTTPLFALLLAVLHPVWSDLHGLAVFIGTLSLALGGLFLCDLLDSPGLRFTRWAGLLFYPLFPLAASTLSSETPLYLALCLGAFASYRRRHFHLAALSAGLAALTRPDAVLVAVVLGLHYLWSHPPQKGERRGMLANLPWQAMLIYLGIGLSWLVFAWVTYGSPIPLTLSAKQQQATVVGSQTFLPGVLTIAGWYASWLYQLQALIALPGLVYGLIRLPVLRWLAAWTVLYFTSYSLLGVNRYFWYYAPLVPLFVLAFGCGLDGFSLLLKTLLHKVQANEVVTTIKTIFRWLPGLVMMMLLLVQVGKLWNMHLKPDARYPIYRAAGEWLRENSPPDASVGTIEVGIIGYYAQRTMVDFAGLIQPDIARLLGTSGSYADTASLAFKFFHIDYLILHQGMFPDLEAEVRSQCQHQITFSGAEYGYSHDLGIFACP